MKIVVIVILITKPKTRLVAPIDRNFVIVITMIIRTIPKIMILRITLSCLPCHSECQDKLHNGRHNGSSRRRILKSHHYLDYHDHDH